eukprot:CAMPEP_0118717366 /NCGR_PEP_ID=MMETSP0800-20121206/28100_1 /TAXON_ID=210618 ORGANISM="Striatella unipunctata, Strain CCMP2910" /NCGR_SAMPLE_ID=MMETSP0800 /ASSEMBLY_ACC=CAM_ASM_000638 /LENGTH=532 /DNA_ID=CAMNT_0006624057 /DNA_START=123 /DNA_END=1721 /DNA_ORIENTATION=-
MAEQTSTARRMASTSTTEATETSQSTATPAYNNLVKQLSAITQLGRCKAVLSYDQLVFMPSMASGERGAQLSALASIIHEKSTDSKLLESIKEAQQELQKMEDGDADVDPDKSILVELELDSFTKQSRVPAELAAKAASLEASAYAAWVEAREKSDFSLFSPVLKDCFQTAMDIADAKRGESDVPLYTQMLDEFEKGMAPERIDDVFQEIKDALVPLIAKVMESKDKPSPSPLEGTFPIDAQQALSESIVKKLGFDGDKGRIDISVHPFTISFSPQDVRITSRFRADEWYQGLAGTIHEGGHAMYEQNLGSSPTSIDTALSMGAHESQSLFWERHVGLSRSFWKWATPLLKENFEDYNYSPEEVYAAVNQVVKGFIRVEADELTYPLHVILRYGIEKDVLLGNLDVDDIPQRWNNDMKTLLDMDVPNDAKGCLQDVHWSGLAIGYFPTYLIGSATAAQLAHYCEKDIPDMYSKIENGEFDDIKAWLTDKIHRHGRRYQSLDAMLQDQLGEPLNPKYFIKYLTDKYSDLYKLE